MSPKESEANEAEQKRKTAKEFRGLVDSLQGMLEKATGGKPLDPDVFSNISKELHTLNTEVSKKLDAIGEAVALILDMLQKEEEP